MDVEEQELVIERQVKGGLIRLVILPLSAVGAAALSLGNSSLALSFHGFDSPGLACQGRPVEGGATQAEEALGVVQGVVSE